MKVGLYILLGVLVLAAVGLQVWMARTSELAGSRSGVVLGLRVFNIVLLLTALALAAYALFGWR